MRKTALLGCIFGTTALLALAGCGSDPGERALSGGAIGAGAGAAGSAITGGNPLTGGLIGGAAGAALGGLTDKDDINLGDPVWDNDDND